MSLSVYGKQGSILDILMVEAFPQKAQLPPPPPQKKQHIIIITVYK